MAARLQISGSVNGRFPAATRVAALARARSGSIKRVATAVGEGSMAVRLVYEHLERMRQRQA